MSDKPIVDLSNIIVPQSVDQAIANITDKPTKEIGDIFNDIMYLVFGGMHSQAEKRRIKYKYALEEFEKSCKEKIEAIPQEHRVEPSTQVACQILEDAKYCAENQVIREMFASLIASTMDSRINQIAHPSFSAIIKQMTSQDARFFKRFKNTTDIPMGNFQLYNRPTNSVDDLLEYAFFEYKNADFKEVQNTSFILSTLERLGLIKITLDTWLYNDSLYKVYEESDILKKLSDTHNTTGRTVRFKRGVASVTVLGQHLLNVCCSDEIVAEGSFI